MVLNQSIWIKVLLNFHKAINLNLGMVGYVPFGDLCLIFTHHVWLNMIKNHFGYVESDVFY